MPGVLTLTCYSYMCLPFGALFCEIWYSDQVFIRDKGAQITNWVFFGQIIVKSTQFGQHWVLFFWKWYTDGWEIRQKIGIEKESNFWGPAGTSTYNFGERNPPGDLCLSCIVFFSPESKVPGYWPLIKVQGTFIMPKKSQDSHHYLCFNCNFKIIHTLYRSKWMKVFRSGSFHLLYNDATGIQICKLMKEKLTQY